MKKIISILMLITTLCMVMISCSKSDDDNTDDATSGYSGPNTLGVYISFQDGKGNDLVRERLDPMVTTPDKGLWLSVGGENILKCERFIDGTFVFDGGIMYCYSSLPLPEKLQGWDLEKNVVDTGHDLLFESLYDILWKSDYRKDGLNKDHKYTIKITSKTLFGDDTSHILDVAYQNKGYDWDHQWQNYDLNVSFDGIKCDVDVDDSFESNQHWGCYGKREMKIVLK